jgi:hypothetical protein
MTIHNATKWLTHVLRKKHRLQIELLRTRNDELLLAITIQTTQQYTAMYNLCSNNSVTSQSFAKEKGKVHSIKWHEGTAKGEAGACCTFLNFGARWGGWSIPSSSRFTSREWSPLPNLENARCAPVPIWTSAQNLAPKRFRAPKPPHLQRDAIPTELSRPNLWQNYHKL